MKIYRRHFGVDSNKPLVSIIINCYNGAEFLSEAIDSLIKQTYQNWEIIFWDNVSVDDSAKIFKRYQDPRLKYYLALKHTSLAKARALAIERANGDWIGFLDCDDMWLPDKLTDQMEIVLNEDSNLGLIYGRCLILNSSNTQISDWGKRQCKYSMHPSLKELPENKIFRQLSGFNFIPIVTALVRKKFYFDIGALSLEIEQAEDYDLFLRLSKSYKVCALDKPIAIYRIHNNNLSIDSDLRGFNEVIYILSKYLPDKDAALGLRIHYAAYSLLLIKQKDFLSGLSILFKKAGMSGLFYTLRRKIFGKIY